MSATVRNNVEISGADGPVMMFAHGFGCDHSMWRHVAPHFADAFRIVTFDYVGAGGSDSRAYDAERYATLDGYAADIAEIGDEIGIEGGIFVGHSVSAMIGALASMRRPGMFDKLVMVGPSPRYIDDDGYRGGFSEADIDALLATLEENPLAWSASMAPAMMGNPDRPALGQELTESFCRLEPRIASDFARATFTSDNRADLPLVKADTLILQCRDDIIAPQAVGEYVRDRIPKSRLVLLDATGHCPNLSAPDDVVAAMRDFV